MGIDHLVIVLSAIQWHISYG